MKETITATLGLDTSAFSQGAEKATKDAKKLEENVNGSTTSIGGLASKVPLAGAAVTAAFGLMWSKSKELADSLLRLETITGMSTDTLQYLTNAAEVNGSSTGAMAAALEFFNKQVANQSDAFKELGIQMVDVNGKQKSTEELYKDVSDALAGMTDKHKQAKYTIELFGRSAQELIPVLSAGSAEIKNMGGTFLTVSKENLEAINGLGDALGATAKGGVSLFAELLGNAIRLPGAIFEASKATAELAASITGIPFDWWVSKEEEKADAAKKTADALWEQELAQKKSLDHARALSELLNRSKFFDKSDSQLEDDLQAKKREWAYMENAEQEEKKAFLSSIKEIQDEMDKRAKKAADDKKAELEARVKAAEKELALQKEIQDIRDKLKSVEGKGGDIEAQKKYNEKLAKLQDELASKQFYKTQSEKIQKGEISETQVMTWEQRKAIATRNVYNIDQKTGEIKVTGQAEVANIPEAREAFNKQQNEALMYSQKELTDVTRDGNKALLDELRKSNELMKRILTIQ